MSEELSTTVGQFTTAGEESPAPGGDEKPGEESPAPGGDEKPGEESPAPGEGEKSGVGSSTSEEEEVEEAEEEAESGEEYGQSDDEGTDQASPEEQLLALGKKYLAAGDASSAVESFQEACSILAEEYGQVSKELAEPYYLYGRALLELSREKSAMFGKGIPGNEGQDSSESGPSGAATSSAGASNGSSSNVEAESSQACGTSEEEESDLQLSWEILELARLICQKESDNEYKLKLSDVNLALGEVGLESDQYQQAIEDLQSSLRLREFALDPTDRRIAEVHFSLGLAYTLAREVDQAIEAYRSSKILLVRRKEELEQKLAEEAEQQETQREIKELEELIPDIESKISDVEDLKKVMQERENFANEPEESTGFDQPSKEFDTSESTAIPVTDISHLVRKRNIADADTNPTKRPCTENGDSTAAADQPSEQ